MAVEVYSDSIPGYSPRISFSRDLNETESVPVEVQPLRLDSSIVDSSSGPEFSFHVTATIDRGITQETSVADVLFANGMILPMDIIKKESRTEALAAAAAAHPTPTLHSEMEKLGTLNRKSMKAYLACGSGQQKPKSFWKLGRSYSLNCYRSSSSSSSCDNESRGFGSLVKLLRSSSTGTKRIQEDKPTNKGLIGSLIGSLPGSNAARESNQDEKPAASRSFKCFMRSTSLSHGNRTRGLIRAFPFLPRSSSTGSSVASSEHLKTKNRYHYQKLRSEKTPHSVDAEPCITKKYCKTKNSSLLPSSQKRQVKKLNGANYDYKARVSPVLNLPSSCAAVDLLGFGLCLFNGNRDRNRGK